MHLWHRSCLADSCNDNNSFIHSFLTYIHSVIHCTPTHPPHNFTLPHEQLHGVFSRTEQGRVPIPHTLHGRALQLKVPLIMNSMQSMLPSTAVGVPRRTNIA